MVAHSFYDLSSLNMDDEDKLDLPMVFSSEDDTRKPRHKYNSNRFKSNRLPSPEIPRGISATIRNGNSRFNRRGSTGADGRRDSADDSIEKITESRPFAIPEQFRNDPEFMRSINHDEKKKKNSSLKKGSNEPALKLPDISTFSEFEPKRHNRKSQRIPVSSVPTDVTNKAIHSLLGDFASKAEGLASQKQKMQSKDQKIRELESKLNQKHREIENLKLSRRQESERAWTSDDYFSNSGSANEVDKLASELEKMKAERDYFMSQAQRLAEKPSGPKADHRPNLSNQRQQHHENETGRDMDYRSPVSLPTAYEKDRGYSTNFRQEPPRDSNPRAGYADPVVPMHFTSQRDEHTSLNNRGSTLNHPMQQQYAFHQMNPIGDDANSHQNPTTRSDIGSQGIPKPFGNAPQWNSPKESFSATREPAASTQTPEAAEASQSSSSQTDLTMDIVKNLLQTLNRHQTTSKAKRGSNNASKTGGRLAFMLSDSCENDEDDANTTIRPAVSSQEAMENLFTELKASYDENYEQLKGLVTEYGLADPAYDKRKRAEIQEKIVSESAKVEHCANLLYMLNDIAIANNLQLPESN